VKREEEVMNSRNERVIPRSAIQQLNHALKGDSGSGENTRRGVQQPQAADSA